MCECGCVANDRKLAFPAPGESFYILTLSGACLNCDAPSGVLIERIDPGHILWNEYKRGEFLDGLLEFEQWPDSVGVAVVTGMRKCEFIKSLLPHLIGINSDELGEDGRIDEAGADAILDEMYHDSTFSPSLAREAVKQ